MTDSGQERLVVDLARQRARQFFGKYRALVENVDDPEKMGRITVKLPAVYGETESPWALPCVPFAGKKHGLVVLPEKGDGVWIEFEEGNRSRPVWTGCWWAKGEMPDPGTTATRILATSKGHKLILDDDGDEVKLLHAKGAAITLTGSEITLEVKSKKIVISSSGVDINNGAFKVS
jgi:uncharacterized protein involved in type VI secretion and phage assembly